MCKPNDANSSAVEQPDYKLPTTVVPSHYVIHETPNFDDFTIPGEVTIDIDVREEVSAITLNARDLMITSAFVEHENGTRLNALLVPATVIFFDPTSGAPVEKSFTSAATLDVARERATFNFAGKLSKGAWKLHISFTPSTVQPSLEGAYRCKWTDDQAVDHWMLATQLAATQARRAFPCFDEPALKATFEIQLSVPEHMTALSNAAVLETTTEPSGLKRVRFATTPKMSTYLVAFARRRIRELGACSGVRQGNPHLVHTGQESPQVVRPQVRGFRGEMVRRVLRTTLFRRRQDRHDRHSGVPLRCHGEHRSDHLSCHRSHGGREDRHGSREEESR